MAKALVAVVFATLLVASLAAQTALSQNFDCKGAKEINKVNNACKLLCDCAANLNKSYKEDDKKRCNTTCEKCKSEANSCKEGSGLPEACKEGQGVKEVNQCITTFLKSRRN